jgi:hopene-associated glycosyltransferase HpnB
VLSIPFLLSAISLLIWIVLTFFRGGFWFLRAFDDDVSPHAAPPQWPAIVAIIPARNEESGIGDALDSLLAQEYPGDFRILVVDDHSEDATAEIVGRRADQSKNAKSNVSLLRAEALEPGWTGKLWALQQGIRTAERFNPEFFWFTDADIVHEPDTLQRLVSNAEAPHRELVSLMVLLNARHFAERLLIPAFLYFFLQLYPPGRTADRTSSVAGAAGGCVLLRRRALQRIGGIAAIRSEVIDDCALARAVKRSGGQIWMGVTRKSVSLRAYSGFGEIRDMIARTAFTQLRYSNLFLVGTLAGMFLTYLVPVIFTFNPHVAVWRTALAAWILMTLTYMPTVRFYRLSALWAPFLPAAAVFYSYATWLSAFRYWRGRGGQWKGRAQAPAGK